jgi:SanA protein
VLKQLWKFVRALLMALAALGVLGLLLPRLITTVYAWSRIYHVSSAPTARVAIVFGAGLTRSGLPTPVLRDRVETAAALYRAGKVEKLLLSGDSQLHGYSEPDAMREYALSLGVPASALVLDYAGLRTYDTCYRARAIFGLDSALLVTQDWHLPRALFTCNALGLKAAGVEAVNRHYWPVMLMIWNLREQVATAGALVDLYVSHPAPMLGSPEPIFPRTAQAPVLRLDSRGLH